MIRVQCVSGIATQVAALCGAVVLGSGGFIPPGCGEPLGFSAASSDRTAYRSRPLRAASCSCRRTRRTIRRTSIRRWVAPWRRSSRSVPLVGPADLRQTLQRSAYEKVVCAGLWRTSRRCTGSEQPGCRPEQCGRQRPIVPHRSRRRRAVRFRPPEKMAFEGAEIISWVGSTPILAADVLYETNKMIDRVLADNPGQVIPPETLAQGRGSCS